MSNIFIDSKNIKKQTKHYFSKYLKFRNDTISFESNT